MTLYGANGQINTTSVAGSSYTGLYAADGSYNIVTNTSSTYVGLHHACGAYNAFVVTDPSAGYYAKNGSLNVISNSNSPSGFSPVQPSGLVSALSLPTANLVSRYIANQGVTLNGSTVSQWNDIVGTNHQTQATAGNQPTNPTNGLGKQSIRLAAGKFMNFPASLSFNNRSLSIFIVCRNLALSNAAGANNSIDAIFSAGASGSNTVLFWDFGTPGKLSYRDSASQATTISYAFNTTLVASVQGASSVQVLQGAESSAPTQGTSNTTTGGFLNQFTSGSPLNTNANLDVFEIAIYNTAVSGTTLAAIQAYYQSVYGVQTTADTYFDVSGDSQAVGINQSDPLYLPWPSQMAAMAKYQPKYNNHSVSSTAVPQMDTAAAALMGADAFRTANSAYTKRILILDGGTNDIALNLNDGPTTFANIQTFRANRIAAGWDEVYHIPIRPRGLNPSNATYEIARQSVNASMLADATISQFLLTSALLHPIWSATDASSTTWFLPDNVHMTDAAATVNAQLMYTFLKSKGRLA